MTKKITLGLTISLIINFSLIQVSSAQSKAAAKAKAAATLATKKPNPNPPTASSLNSKTDSKFQTKYISEIDQALSIEKISIAPLIDNVGEIYSKPLTETEISFFEKSNQWNPKLTSKKFDSENLTVAEVKKITAQDKTQALITGRIWKGPAGVQMRLVFYLAADGLPFLIEYAEDIKAFSTEGLSRELTLKLISLSQKFPTQGIVLSRRANDVTVNMGSYHGLQTGDTLNVVQILQIQRHPKQQFMVSHDKVLLGQIRVTQVDQFLSFGQISLEKEAGVIQVGAKIKPDQFIQYKLADDGTMVTLRDRLQQRPESQVAFGEKAQEWQPRSTPQYGRLQLEAGFGQYNQNLSLQTAGSLSTSNSLAPMIAVTGEAWLNDEWYLDLGMKQSAFSVSNSLAGSSPSSLNMSLSAYHLALGYNFLFEDNFWGPKFQMSFGISQFSARADDSSPLFMTSQDIGGMYLGFKGAFPLGQDLPYDLGFQFKYYLSNSLSEGKSSGSASGIKATDFGFFGSYKTKYGFNIIAELSFEYYSASFSGTGVRADPATSNSHKLTNILGGVEYFF